MTTRSLSRRGTIKILGAFLVLPNAVLVASAAQTLPKVQAYRDPGCGCCEKWTEHMKAAGFDISMQDDPDLAARKTLLGVPDQLSGCHTALVGRYVIEGHVPAQDIVRLLTKSPDIVGLAVPGMPMGSPGVEMGESKESYEVYAFSKDGRSVLFAVH